MRKKDWADTCSERIYDYLVDRDGIHGEELHAIAEIIRQASTQRVADHVTGIFEELHRRGITKTKSR